MTARPALLVAIDTEGDNQWSARTAATRRSTTYALDKLHEFFERHDVRPTRHHSPGGDRFPLGRSLAIAPRARHVRDRRTITLGKRLFSADDVDRHPYALSLPLTV